MGTSDQAWLEDSQQHSSSYEVEGCGNPLPANRRPRSSCGLHREAGAARGKGFCWELPPHVACEVPELKITVGPNLSVHQDKLTALLETRLCSTWLFLVAHKGFSCLHLLHVKAHYLHFYVFGETSIYKYDIHGTLIGKVWNKQCPQKTFSGQLCLKLTHLQLSPYQHSAPGGTFEQNRQTLWV